MQSVKMRAFGTKEEKKEAPPSVDPARGHLAGGAQETATRKSRRGRRQAWPAALPGCLACAVYRVTFLPNNKEELGDIAALPTGTSQDGRPTVCSQLTLREEQEAPLCAGSPSPTPRKKTAPRLPATNLP